MGTFLGWLEANYPAYCFWASVTLLGVIGFWVLLMSLRADGRPDHCYMINSEGSVTLMQAIPWRADRKVFTAEANSNGVNFVIDLARQACPGGKIAPLVSL